MSSQVLLFDTEGGLMEMFSGAYARISMIRTDDDVWCNGCYTWLPIVDLKLHLKTFHTSNEKHEHCNVCECSHEEQFIDHGSRTRHREIFGRKLSDVCIDHLKRVGQEKQQGFHDACRMLNPKQMSRRFPTMVEVSKWPGNLFLPQAKIRKGSTREPVEVVRELLVKEEAVQEPQLRESSGDEEIERRMKTMVLLTGRRVEENKTMLCGPYCGQHLFQATGYVEGTKLTVVRLQKETKKCKLCIKFRRCVNKKAAHCAEAASVCASIRDLGELQSSRPFEPPEYITLSSVAGFEGLVDFKDYDFVVDELLFRRKKAEDLECEVEGMVELKPEDGNPPEGLSFVFNNKKEIQAGGPDATESGKDTK